MEFSRFSSGRMLFSNLTFDTMHVVCTELLCIMCINYRIRQAYVLETSLSVEYS